MSAAPAVTEAPLHTWSAAALARAIATRQRTSREVVDAHIARIEAVDPKLHAVVVQRFAAARAEADAADAAVARGDELGPLHGVPITLKECFELEGTASTFGIEARRTAVAATDDRYVAALRGAGAIVLAKTNVAQYLLFFETDNPVYGRTDHPTDPTRSPGGSSGGEAALIAAGGSPLGLGTDLGGSSRIPAAFCGIVGFKPTMGRLPDPGTGSMPVGEQAIPSQVGVMARAVGDVALGLRVLDAVPDPIGRARLPLGDPAGFDVRGMTVGVWDDDGTFPACPAARRAVREAADALAARGARVVRFAIPGIAGSVDRVYQLFSSDGARGITAALGSGRRDPRIAQIEGAGSGGRLKLALIRLILRLTNRRKTLAIVANYGATDTSTYWERVAALDRWRADVLAAVSAAGIDVLLSPSSPLPALKHGASQELGTLGAYTTVYNALGWPAGVVPWTRVRAGEESDRVGDDVLDATARATEAGSAGMPIGVQLAGRPWDDARVLAAMAALEGVGDHSSWQPR
jgi:fatty acid amide hydrolase